MKKVLVITTSLRKNSNSTALADLIKIHRNGRSIRVLFKETIGDASSLIQKKLLRKNATSVLKKRTSTSLERTSSKTLFFQVIL